MTQDNKKGLIYLASPYSHEDKAIEEERYQAVMKAAAYLIQQGYTVFSPIMHNHVMDQKYIFPEGWSFWKNFCDTYLRVASKMIILKIPGYLASIGIDGEIKICDEIKIPFEYLTMEEVERGLLT